MRSTDADFLGQNRAWYIEAQRYFDGLLKHMDLRIEQLTQIETQMASRRELPAGLTAPISKSSELDARGCEYTRYQSRNTRVLLYCNYPTGFIYVEFLNLIPWLAKRTSFSIKLGHRGLAGVNARSIGAFLDNKPLGWENVGDLLIETLLQSSISEEALQARDCFVETP
jgi:hypothetical protein